MTDKHLPAAVIKKAYEIAYALCRIAPAAPHSLGGIWVEKGVELLNSATKNDSLGIKRSLEAISYFVKLGCGIGAVSQRNADVLLEQGRLLGNELQDAGISTGTQNSEFAEVDLADIFSDGFGNEFEVREYNEAVEAVVDDLATGDTSGNPAIVVSGDNEHDKLPEVPTNEVVQNEQNGDAGFAFSLSSGIRQSAILGRIRQSGNCRIKDLQGMFPQYSERTLRYDLEYLIGRHLVERIGAGSATAYKPIEKQSVNN